MVQINEIVPSRFRVGDLITVKGFGFSPTFGANDVAIAGIPEPLQSESGTELTLFVPAGVPVGQYVGITVFRNDSLDNDFAQAWSEDAVDDLRTGAVRVPGQAPGAAEAASPGFVPDAPQAQDYERMVTAIEHLLFDSLAAVGDVFGTDGVTLVPTPIGGDTFFMQANPAAPTGVDYIASIPRAQSVSYGGKVLSATVALQSLIANGDADTTNPLIGFHEAPSISTIRDLVVLFANEVSPGGNTLDRVRILVNGALNYDTGAGLGLVAGQSHVDQPNIGVAAGDNVEVEVQVLTTLGDTRFVAALGFR